MFKKTVIFLVSLMLVCMTLVTVTSAAQTCKVDVTQSVEGESLFITVTFSEHNDPDGIIGAECYINFDSSVLEFVGSKTVFPEEWGEYGDDWTKLKSEGTVLAAIVRNTGETDPGAMGDISLVVEFKLLKTNVETTVEVTNCMLNEAADVSIIYGADTVLKVSVSESGDVSGEVSSSEVSVPEESVTEETSAPEAESEADASEQESESSVPVSNDTSVGTNGGNSNWIVWVVISVAVVAAAAVAAVIVIKKKKQ